MTHTAAPSSPARLAAQCVGALGVVYGDIGTSPLYALELLFFRPGQPAPDASAILGGVSLVIWALTLVVTLKYTIFVLQADNDGEGGVFALYGLLDKVRGDGRFLFSWLLLLGAGLLFGDGCITPAISVLSAVEGLSVATPTFTSAILPITIALLTVLFAVQYKGTGGMGRAFGPVMVVWFLVIAGIGLTQIIGHPGILAAFNPYYGIAFLHSSGLRGALLVMGAVVLCVTGGEAMYADMGHFGAKPIRLSWLGAAYPCLLLNYLGQGAYMLSGGAVPGGNLFYALVPVLGLLPMVALATLATIIASQALISGAFSLTSQAIHLGMFPRLKVTHTHDTQAGEVYVGFINWALYVGCVLLVLGFGSAEALGAAYGLAESGVMIITTSSMFLIAQRYWHWSALRAGALFGALACLDFSFLFSNSLKFMQGGFVPLTIGLTLFLIMAAWRWGRKITYGAYSTKHTMTLDELLTRHRTATAYIERTAILMVPGPGRARVSTKGGSAHTPALLQMLWDRLGLLPRHLVFVQVVHPKVPYVHESRYAVTVLDRHEQGSIVRVELRFGFMEDPNVERALAAMVTHKEIDLSPNPHQWIVHVAHEHLLPARHMRAWRRVRLALYEVLRHVSRPTYYHYGLGDEVQLTTEILPVRVR
jgi:KUP system potassium uptake protein